MDGILNLYKDKDMTSFAAVSKIRRIFGQKRVGHAGTLDPMATGVLPILVGKAAVMQEKLSDHDKRYTAGIRLGLSTDTGDVTGKTLKTADVSVTTDEFVSAIMSFIGKIMQTPPMYSAIQIDGKRLYDLARRGIEVERQAREIEIYDISLTERINDTDFLIDVGCSKGTYIRTLCEDIGKKLGVPACMFSLERTECAGYKKENSVSISELEKLYNEGKTNELNAFLLPIEPLFSHLPKVRLPEFYTRLCLNGCEIYIDKLKIKEDFFALSDGECRVYTYDGKFIGNAFLCDFEEGKAIKIKYRFI